MNRKVGLIALALYIGSIVLANYVVERFGVVPVGFGFMGPAAVYVVGLSFTLRDLVQSNLGRLVVIPAVLVGAGLSALVSPQFALASGLAFLFSETADFAVYTPLRKRGWVLAVAASNAVGLVVDSIIFLWLAFGSQQFLAGQVVGKAWMTLLAILLLAPARRAVLPRYA